MNAVRPIGHIASNLRVAAIAINHRITHSHTNAVLQLWCNDDGCLYLAQEAHPHARAVKRTAPHHIIVRYRKQPALTWRDIHVDLEHARTDFAQRAMAETIAA